MTERSARLVRCAFYAGLAWLMLYGAATNAMAASRFAGPYPVVWRAIGLLFGLLFLVMALPRGMFYLAAAEYFIADLWRTRGLIGRGLLLRLRRAWPR